jgi:hypothetical protein
MGGQRKTVNPAAVEQNARIPARISPEKNPDFF